MILKVDFCHYYVGLTCVSFLQPVSNLELQPDEATVRESTQTSRNPDFQKPRMSRTDFKTTNIS